MSFSDSDSGSDCPEDMIVRLANIKTIGELFKTGTLKAAANQRYKADATFLDRVSLFQGDITVMEVDSIVNAANRSLLGGGGGASFLSSSRDGAKIITRVDGAIHSAAGRKLLEECRTLGGCDTGESKITSAYKLPSKHIIHTVGPVYSRSDLETRAQQLQSCYKTSLNLAVEHNLKHIAFPSVSTGIYGYPIEDATHIALDVVRRFCESDVGSKLDRIIFVVWSNKDKEVYETLIPEYFPSQDASESPPPSDAGNPPSSDVLASDDPSVNTAAVEVPVLAAAPQTSDVPTDRM
ncbi:A1pp-domain-containing protein [Mycena venus]|uniref:A1pp-domain-containing protein n=1 Tax=Mycena venus TaxID=2733690 RepID=A0A8H7CCG8_9AGAR|nr:A1pp-domain-containing protein [Mycena venus]